MREASQGESLGDSEDVKFYQDMFDQQLAVQMSKGNGLGLASRLIEQLTRDAAAEAAADSAAAPPADRSLRRAARRRCGAHRRGRDRTR